jgi:hypothetical protein
MSLQSGSLQTPLTEFNVPGALDGQVMGIDVLDPTENDEKTSLLETDDEFDVVLSWQLTGASTPIVGAYWIVSLYSDDMDGVGAMTGLISGPAVIPITGGMDRLEYRFQVPPPVPPGGPIQADRDHQPLANGRPGQGLGNVRLRGVHTGQDH